MPLLEAPLKADGSHHLWAELFHSPCGNIFGFHSCPFSWSRNTARSCVIFGLGDSGVCFSLPLGPTLTGLANIPWLQRL
uniref:Uncharacterized protein n=1 Tax=Anguilla anguilla TaxID=7936 RepID=A0A0E9Q7H2_ANGAN